MEARPRSLAARGAGQGDRRRPDPYADRRAGGHSSAAVSRQRCGAGVRAALCDPPRRARRPRISSARTWTAGRSWRRHRGMRSCELTPSPEYPRAHRGGGPPVRAEGRRCSGSVRVCSGRQPAATSCAPVRCCPRSPGNLGKPGAGFSVLERQLGRRGIDDLSCAARIWRPSPAPSISHMDFVDVLEDHRRSRALFVWNMNPLASCPQQSRLRRAWNERIS